MVIRSYGNLSIFIGETRRACYCLTNQHFDAEAICQLDFGIARKTIFCTLAYPFNFSSQNQISISENPIVSVTNIQQ